MTDTLILVSDSYPFQGVTEASFIAPEIGVLSKRFGKIVILPLSARGVPERLPANVEVDTSLCVRPSALRKAVSIFNPSSIGMALRDFSASRNLRDLMRSLSQSCYVSFFRGLIRKFIDRKGIDIDRTLFYTFWFDFATAAISGINGAKVVTRAHGYDIFEERGYISPSWRRYSLKRLTKCFPASEYGAKYMSARYPEYADRISARILGSNSPVGMNPDGDDGFLSIYGCSRLSEEKGVARQFEFLSRFAAENPHLRIAYTHIGDGPMIDRLRRIAAGSPSNIDFILTGALPNCEVHRLLSTAHQDLAVLLSHTEGGIPLSLCEALSYGIPVLATSVGGITEIPDDCGIFLSPDCTFEEFSSRMLDALKNMASMRKNAGQVWEQNFDNRKLRASFAEEISML